MVLDNKRNNNNITNRVRVRVPATSSSTSNPPPPYNNNNNRKITSSSSSLSSVSSVMSSVPSSSRVVVRDRSRSRSVDRNKNSRGGSVPPPPLAPPLPSVEEVLSPVEVKVEPVSGGPHPLLPQPSNRKSEQGSCSSTFRLGGFTKSLLAKARLEDHDPGLSPGTLESLVNPMRSQLGLPSISLFNTPSPQSSSDENERTNSGPIIGGGGGIGVGGIMGRASDGRDSGVESSNSDSRIELEGIGMASNSSFEDDDVNALRRMILGDTSDASSTHTLVEGSSRGESLLYHHQQQDSFVYKPASTYNHPPAAVGAYSAKPVTQAYHTKTKPNNNNYYHPGPPPPGNKHQTQANFEQGHGDQNSDRFINSNVNKAPLSLRPSGSNTGDVNTTAPEIAAVIPTPNPKKHLNSKKLQTPKTNTGNLMRQKSLPSLCNNKENKKNSGGGSGGGTGWKFTSEHVQGKEYLIIKQLGKGGCGEVLLVIEKESRELFALKRVNLMGVAESGIDECVNEVQMLVDLRDSDLVVHIYAWELDKAEKTMKILMEHGQCDLQRSIKTSSWTPLKLRAVWEQILLITDLIHKRGIVHADLKPANFIWAGDNLKIIDFGIASRLQLDHTSIAMLNPKGTLNFVSPETIQPDSLGLTKISPKSDIWSLGCILYSMVYGKTPFDHITHPAQKIQSIVKGAVEYPPVPPTLGSCTSEILSALRLCFEMDYKRRPSTVELLNHPLVKQ